MIGIARVHDDWFIAQNTWNSCHHFSWDAFMCTIRSKLCVMFVSLLWCYISYTKTDEWWWKEIAHAPRWLVSHDSFSVLYNLKLMIWSRGWCKLFVCYIESQWSLIYPVYFFLLVSNISSYKDLVHTYMMVVISNTDSWGWNSCPHQDLHLINHCTTSNT